MWEIHNLKYIGFIHKGEKMNNNERDEKFLKSWLKKKISITTSTVVSFLITGAGVAYGVVMKEGNIVVPILYHGDVVQTQLMGQWR